MVALGAGASGFRRARSRCGDLVPRWIRCGGNPRSPLLRRVLEGSENPRLVEARGPAARPDLRGVVLLLSRGPKRCVGTLLTLVREVLGRLWIRRAASVRDAATRDDRGAVALLLRPGGTGARSSFPSVEEGFRGRVMRRLAWERGQVDCGGRGGEAASRGTPGRRLDRVRVDGDGRAE